MAGTDQSSNPRTPRPATPREGSIAENLTQAIRFLLTQPELLGAQLLDLFSVLFGGAPAHLLNGPPAYRRTTNRTNLHLDNP